MGTVVSPHLAVGVDFVLWRRQTTDDGAVSTLATVIWYPRARGGSFLQGSTGITRFHGIRYADGPQEQGTGPAIALAAGYDARFSRALSLTPMVSAMYSDIGTTRILSQPVRRATRAWLLAFSVGFTWH